MVFKSAKFPQPHCRGRIEKRIVADFGFPVSVISRTADEMAKDDREQSILKQLRHRSRKTSRRFSVGCSGASCVEEVGALTLEPDQSRCLGKEVYLYFPNGESGSSLMEESTRSRIIRRHHDSQLENREQPSPDVPGLPLMAPDDSRQTLALLAALPWRFPCSPAPASPILTRW